MAKPSFLLRLSGEQLWLGIGLFSFGLAGGSLVLTALLDLHPCHLCIFQRLLFIKLGVLGIATYALRGVAQRITGDLAILVAGVGIGVSSYQSWLEAQPTGTASCTFGEPSLIEQLVEWLGQLAPSLFLATGFCEEPELHILGLSLANLALASFLSILLVAGTAWAIRTRRFWWQGARGHLPEGAWDGE